MAITREQIVPQPQPFAVLPVGSFFRCEIGSLYLKTKPVLSLLKGELNAVKLNTGVPHRFYELSPVTPVNIIADVSSERTKR